MNVTINAKSQVAVLHLRMIQRILKRIAICIVEDHIPKEMVDPIQNATSCLLVIRLVAMAITVLTYIPICI